MRWSRRHPHEAWIGTVLLISLLFLGVTDSGMSSAGNAAIMVTIACALALIVGDLVVMLFHRRGHHVSA
jgi:hypothetical protein